MADNTPDNGGQARLMSIPEAAVFLGVSDRTIRRYLSAGKLQAVEIGGKTCVQADSLARLRPAHEGADSMADSNAQTVNVADKTRESVRHVSDSPSPEVLRLYEELKAAQAARIAHLEAENARLWGMVEDLTARALPPARTAQGEDPAVEREANGRTADKQRTCRRWWRLWLR
jgi:excisionase family DNA binding protein